MIFLAGPRQVGKTFLAKEELKIKNCQQLYYNFDLPEMGTRFRSNPSFFESEARSLKLDRPSIVFDEIHKRSKWKNELKAIYDRDIEFFNIIVTGSARLDLLRQTGESLAGRYFLFRVFPVGLREYTGNATIQKPFENFKEIIDLASSAPTQPKALDDLLQLGGFPDPLSQGQMNYRLKWATDYRRLILREDLRDLSRIMEIDRVETLWQLLPDRVGSPMSVRSLQEDLSASHEAVKTWLLNLEKLYSIYSIQPYSKKIARTVKKERKYYLMDWALIQDESKRFENFVMSTLLRTVSIWNDLGLGSFDVNFIRNVQSQEADFLLTKDSKPWIIGDIKLTHTNIERHLYSMSEKLGDIPIIQVIKKPGIFELHAKHSLVISADQFLGIFL